MGEQRCDFGDARLRSSACLAVVTAGCGDDDDSATGSITVFAAASLTDAFTELGSAFEDANPGTTVELNFGASSALREQILAGAPADVFASANTSNMDQVVDAGAAADPEAFVSNQLQIATPAGNAAGITGLADFADADLLIGLCAEEVPCGQFGREALANAGVTPSIDTNAPDVRALLTQIESGDLDAGIVYRTDVLAAGDAVEGIEIPPDENVVASYPIAVLTAAGNPEVAEAFVAFVPLRAGSGDPRRLRVRRGLTARERRTDEPHAVGAGAAGGVAIAFVVVPFVALLQRAPWSDMVDLLGRPARRRRAAAVADHCLRRDRCSRWSSASRLAWVLTRITFPGRSFVRGPRDPADGAAAGRGRRRVALRLRSTRAASAARSMTPPGFLLPFSTWGVVAANTFVALPFLVLTVEAGLRSVDRRYEDAAATLGADNWTVFRRVTLPAIAPSLAAGAVLAWARALGEFGATVTFAGNLQGRTQTMPLAVYLALESDRDAAIALSLVLIAVSLAVLLPLRDRWLAA